MVVYRFFLVALLWCGAIQAQDAPPSLSLPEPAAAYRDIVEGFSGYDVILRPDTIAPEWWAGAPSVCRGADRTFWLAARMRTAESERGLRGYEIRILKSDDGVSFEKVHAIHRDDIPIKGFERPALLRDAETGKFKLYLCGPWQDGPWSIFKLEDADSPADFDPKTAYRVIAPPEKQYPRDQSVIEYKDPFILYANGQYHCYVTGYMRRNERLYHYASDDGETWAPVGNPYNAIMDLSGWHDFFVRPSCVVPMGVGYLFVYEGGKTNWYDPVYNIATGIGWTFDLNTIVDLTPEAPLFVSDTPNAHFATFRYSHWLVVEDELWIYAEVAAPDETHELRLYRAPLNASAQ